MEEDDPIEKILAELRKEEVAREQFAREVTDALDKHGAYEVRSQFEPDGKIIIHRSTRAGVEYQVTFIEGSEPTGHTDARKLSSAISRAYEDLHRSVKARLLASSPDEDTLARKLKNPS